MSKPDLRAEIKTLVENRFSPEQKQNDYEHRVIGHILTKCSGKNAMKYFQRLYYQKFASYTLDMKFFRDVCDDFPVYLVADAMVGTKLHKDRTASFARSFTAFDATPFAKCYRRHEKKYDGVLPLVVVFPRDNIPLGLVIHAGIPGVRKRVGTQLYHRDSQGLELCVEPFAGLLKAIHRSGEGWQPRMS